MKHIYSHTLSSLLLFLSASLLAVAVTSCSKDEESVVDLTAYVADDYSGNAKISIDANQYACWETGDYVNVNGSSYPVTVSGTYKRATIEGVLKNDGNKYTAVYPASCAGEITPGSTTVNINLPTTQTWNASHIFSPMVATYNGGQLNFHNPCNLLAVTVTNKTGNALMVHSIIVESTVNYITGTFSVSGCDGSNPTTEYSSDGGKMITLDCGNQSIGNGNSAVFYVSVPKVTDEVFHFSVNAKTVVSETTTKYTFAKDSRTLTIENNQLVAISVATDDAAVSTNANFWGKGNSSYPYLITDYADLKTLSDLVSNSGNDETYNASGIFYRQTDDFTITDANWGTSSRLAVGSTTNAFKANYDGGGHTDTLGVTIVESGYPVGVFGVVGNGAKISNLTVAGSIDLGNTYGDIDAGGVAGKVTGNSNFTSCTNEAAVTSTYTTAALYGVGGVCGAVNATDCTVTFTSCTNSAQVKAYGLKNGGIVGLCTAGTLNLTTCTNSGAIVSYDGSSTYYDHCGGIIGMVSSSNGTVTLTSCVNNGNITGNGSVGGFIGQTNRACEITGTSSNNGDVTGNGGSVAGVIDSVQESATITIHGISTTNNNPVEGGYNVAGIVGFTDGAITLENCYNLADITATVDVARPNGTYNCYGVGGILGRINASSYTLTINFCKNTGHISSSASSSKLSLGGIVGYSNNGNTNNSTIYNCYNTGEISGDEFFLGGIAGIIYKKLVVANCYNIGSISGRLNSSGSGCGIVGRTQDETSYPCYINNCYNKGSISGVSLSSGSSTEYRYGIARVNSSSYTTNCYNNTSSICNSSGKKFRSASFSLETGELTPVTNGFYSIAVAEIKSQANWYSGEGSYTYLKDALQAWCNLNSSITWSEWSDDAIPTFNW